ncbi:uncharacterized protein LOC136077945 [Hydra vulgaris]|uniref:Uncharacterized protein LOC136077945 n=1 Tax=Hydra vulgaris TaxID=6087 RepID=A0ABM4BH93_HYDVU
MILKLFFKSHFLGCNDLLHLEEVLGRPNVHFKILVDDDGVTLKGVMWSSSEQLELLSQYGDVILMDSTFKVNSQGFPLFTLLVTDAFGIGQPVAHCLLQREDISSISEFLVWLKEGLNKAIFVIDKDSAEIRAIRNTFPGSSIFLCRFHMLKAFLEELNKHKFPEERRSKIYGIFENMVKCSSQDEYDVLVKEFEYAGSELSYYFNRNWNTVSMIPMFTGYTRIGKLHLDNHTTNRLECFHAKN